MNVNTPIEDHCCKAMERCANILIEKRYINGQERWMWERVKKSGKIGANEIIFCPYCGNDLNRRAQQPNKPLTCDGCCENKPDEPWREICSECKRKPRQDLYAHKPEEGEKDENSRGL